MILVALSESNDTNIENAHNHISPRVAQKRKRGMKRNAKDEASGCSERRVEKVEADTSKNQ
jgi:hypothetical protein